MTVFYRFCKKTKQKQKQKQRQKTNEQTNKQTKKAKYCQQKPVIFTVCGKKTLKMLSNLRSICYIYSVLYYVVL